MAPDLNSLPPSRSPDHSALQSRVFGSSAEAFPRQSPSPRSSSISLAAAATINAGIQQQGSRRSSISSNRGRGSPQVGRSERRRSNVAMSLNLNDPALPGQGELAVGDHRSSIGHPFRTVSPHSISPTMATGDPHHQRAPSLGELHQELEQEQEAQVVSLARATHVAAALKLSCDAEPPPPNDPPAASTAAANATSDRIHSLHQYRCSGRLHNHVRALPLLRSCSSNLAHVRHKPKTSVTNTTQFLRSFPPIIPSFANIQPDKFSLHASFVSRTPRTQR